MKLTINCKQMLVLSYMRLMAF